MTAIIDNSHGARVVDPFRWLEQVGEPVVQTWLAEQADRTETHLRGLPGRGAIEKRLRKLWDYPRQSVPIRRGDRTFFFRNTGLQNQPVLFVQDGAASEPRVLLDPNTWSPEGTVALSAWAFTEDGRKLAYALSRHGSDWQEVRIRDVATSQDLEDILRWVRFTSLAFSPDGTGLYYGRYPTPGSVPREDEHYYQKLYFHRL